MIPLANQWLKEAGAVLGRCRTPDGELGSVTPWCLIELWTVQKFKMLPSSFLSFMRAQTCIRYWRPPKSLLSPTPIFFHILFWLLPPNTPHVVWPLTKSSPTFCLLPTLFCIHSLKTYCQQGWYDVSYFRLLLPVTFAYWNISICGLQLFALDTENVDS